MAAFLLKDAGADVEALHMTNWEDDDGYCSAAEDLRTFLAWEFDPPRPRDP